MNISKYIKENVVLIGGESCSRNRNYEENQVEFQESGSVGEQMPSKPKAWLPTLYGKKHKEPSGSFSTACSKLSSEAE